MRFSSSAPNGLVRHLLTTRDLSDNEVISILERAGSTDLNCSSNLSAKNIVAVFFEDSTRTLSGFDIAIKSLGGNVVKLNIGSSSMSKGESMADTIANINSMRPDGIVVRDRNSGTPKFISSFVGCPIVNAGDGRHAHPTQALLDLYTIAEHYGGIHNIKGKKVAIVGDVRSSRVANSDIDLFTRFGLVVYLVAPPHFLNVRDVYFCHDLSVIGEVDIILSLRTQVERHGNRYFSSLEDYGHRFCITKDLIGDRDVVVLHPGPVNRNVDISDDVLSDSRCKVLQQVRNGVKVRMSVSEYFFGT